MIELNEAVALAKQPVFWVVSTIFAFVLSIAANLVTPKAGSWIDRYMGQRKIRGLKRRVEQRDLVLTCCEDTSTRLETRLEGITYLLRSLILLALSNIVFFLVPLIQIDLLINGLGLCVAFLGLMRMERAGGLLHVADTARRRLHVSNAFLATSGHSTASSEYKNFLDNWDNQEFGVNSATLIPTVQNNIALDE